MHLENWATKLDVVAPVAVPAFGGEAAYSAFRDSFLRLLGDRDTFTYSVLVIVEGTRPAAGGGTAGGREPGVR